MKYYSLKNILEKECDYYVIFGERSNGKTFAVQEYGIDQYWKSGKQMAVIRRWQDDFTGKRGSTMFDGVVNAGVVTKITRGEWTGVYYWSSRWYLCRYDEKGKRETQDEPFAFGFSITSMEHDKSTSYPNITTVLFDEFLSRRGYIPDEFPLFCNVLSTIIRNRSDVKIFMLGNTVNKFCPYFQEMGLKHIKEMKQGDIDIYQYGESKLRVAVEYCASNKQGKESDHYFAFDSPSLSMIKSGEWELAIYPHCPVKYLPKDIYLIYFILFEDELLQCEIVSLPSGAFTFIHRKTTPLKDDSKDIVFSPVYDHRPNWKRKITKPRSGVEKAIAGFFERDKVFYQDNDVGEVVRNYLIWCGKAAV